MYYTVYVLHNKKNIKISGRRFDHTAEYKSHKSDIEIYPAVMITCHVKTNERLTF